MNIDQLQCFLTVADTLNFARAAEQLHVTQPAVTQQIHALERELGVPLFRRTTRTVRITEEGLAFLDDAREIVARAERARLRFHSADSEIIRTLSIASQSAVVLGRIVPALEALAHRWPDLHPRLQIVPHQHIFSLLEEGHLDAALAFRPEHLRKPRAVYRELCRTRLVCAVRRDHPLAGQECVTPARLAGEKLVLFQPHPDGRPGPDGLLTAHPPKDLYFCETPEATGILVQAGFGVALLPELLAPRLPDLKLLVLQQTEPVSFGVYCRAQQNDALLKDLIRSLRQLDWPLP